MPELRAADGEKPAGGARLFVFVTYKAGLTGFESFCAYVPLPPLRLSDARGERRWLHVRTGQPLPPLEVREADPKACGE